jgi:hypothetical protein
VEREELLERLRERLKALEGLEPREPKDLLQASIILQRAERDVEDYILSARRYELFNPLKKVEGVEHALFATYSTLALNGGGEEVIKRTRKDLEEATKALREILARL